MPNRNVHRNVGSVAGGGAAARMARGQPSTAQLMEIVGGIGGGIVGARLPDVIDPPTSGRHRSVGHGVVPVGTATSALLKMLTEWQAGMRLRADAEHAEYQAASSCPTQAWHLLLSLLWRAASGALVGLVAGYLSHLAMDFTTPAGLPILG